ncbi:MAG: cytochrome-c oxidase, cbb3-type subunit I [Lentisphaeria bacterium]|nr:cytochrome-c oxidase, cbb3-type subunit I [Lentisphaeria bacterium]
MSNLEVEYYDNKIVRDFAFATCFWGVIGMLVGLLIAIQLVNPFFNFNTPYLTFSRLRPLHTNAVIFAFVGNAIFMGVYYSLQRLCKRRMYSDRLSKIHFWGWQLIIVAAAITLPLGFTTSKEYAELEWPIDIAITVIWVIFGLNMMMTIFRRREKHMYVAIWFYIATFFTVAILHVVNSLEIPVSFLKSYSVYAGVQDALVQWWYGHNAVAFFLTTPYIGLMYYFLPKAANRPIYSYRLSIIHFWSLIFIYIWAGPHHLMFTALPEWVQHLGMAFSIMLIAPSWGGMLNGLLTLKSAWDRVREEATLKFMVIGLAGYGMATFEGPILSIRPVNRLAHYTDWIIAHVHVGALAWNGFVTFGILYWLIPKIYNTKLFSRKMANLHFWIGFVGIIIYVIPLYWAGVKQGLMWMQFDNNGFLKYGDFTEIVNSILPMYKLRALGGAIYLFGTLLMIWNLYKTMKQGKLEDNEKHEFPVSINEKHEEVFKKGFIYSHRFLEGKLGLFTVLTVLAVLIGGLIEIVPMFLIKSNVPTIKTVTPYTPLEQMGRDIYIREGCNNCHSQMIRPFRDEVARYDKNGNDYSKAGEFVYDHPFLWGSKRTGPDLHRIGGVQPNSWHYYHLENPASRTPGSIMPRYSWLLHNDVQMDILIPSIKSLRRIGVPYPKGYEDVAIEDYKKQAMDYVLDLEKDVDYKELFPNAKSQEEIRERAAQKEIIPLIAYLQRLGTDIKKVPEVKGKE